MQRYFLCLSYKGTHFHGWQLQDNAVTVQQELEHCLNLLLRENVRITGCGRTDTGVHARKYVAHVDVRKKLSADEIFQLLRKVNMFLPESVVVHQMIAVDEEMHARFNAIQRTYKYFITRKKSPFLSEFTYEYSAELNLRLMQLACNVIRQYKDFSSFSKTGGSSKTNICKVTSASWDMHYESDLLVFTITADRFLRNMVRALVGTMLDIGREKISLTDLRKIIDSRRRSSAGASIDAKGLFLWNVEYDGVTFDELASIVLPGEISILE